MLSDWNQPDFISQNSFISYLKVWRIFICEFVNAFIQLFTDVWKRSGTVGSGIVWQPISHMATGSLQRLLGKGVN